ncbi:hypothetical protein PYCC9005_002238 [Savitreella phatthalungensis]
MMIPRPQFCQRLALLRQPLCRTSVLASCRRYAVSLKGPRNEQISAPLVKLLDRDGKYVGDRSLSEILATLDRDVGEVLINLTPASTLPTCRLFTAAQLKEEQARQYHHKRERKKSAAQSNTITTHTPQTLKELTIGWAVTMHDLSHKLAPGLEALRRGGRVDVLVGLRRKRGAKPVAEAVKQSLLDHITQTCGALGKEWKPREGDLRQGVTLHYQGDRPTIETSEG